ncbi:MAG: NfeD family protein [Pirellulaceae bacterium]
MRRARQNPRHPVRQRRLWPVWLTAVSFLLAAALLSAEDAPPAKPAAKGAAKTYRQAAVIHFEGPITPWLEGYFSRKLAAAKKAGADLIVVEVDSPGGYVDESQEMAEMLRDASWAHTVAYVPDEALSGAAFVSLGCDEIVMRPGARLGDVGVIFLDPDFMFRYAPEKYKSDLVQRLRGLAIAKGRPPALAEAMVDMDVEVFRYRHKTNGSITFLSELEQTNRPDAAEWEKLELVLESQKGRFLEVSGTRAVELQLASSTVSGEEELRNRYQVAGEWREYRPDTADKAVYILSLWWITALLFIVGLVGLLYELSAPGTCIGGITALLCFALFYWSRFHAGTSGMLELVLFGTGVLLLAVEIFVLPGFGVTGVGGILLIVVSMILACQNFIVPRSEHDWHTLLGSSVLVLSSCAAFTVVAGVMMRYFHVIPVLKGMILAPPVASESAVVGPGVEIHRDGSKTSGKSIESAVSIGSIGRTETPLRPIGRARFGDAFLDVVCEGDYIPKGASIRVLEIQGHKVIVEAANI